MIPISYHMAYEDYKDIACNQAQPTLYIVMIIISMVTIVTWLP